MMRDSTKRLIKEVFNNYFRVNGFVSFFEQDWILSYKNRKSIFRFTEGYSSINLTISNIKDESKEFNIGSIYYAIHSEVLSSLVLYSNGEDDRLRKQLQTYLNCLSGPLNKIVKGDFSWVQKLEDNEERDRLVFKTLWSLSIDDPIYKKFKEGDLSWENDIISLLKI